MGFLVSEDGDEHETRPKYVSEITVEVSCHPAMVPAMFDLLRTQAAMCNFPDVGEFYPRVLIEFGGDQYANEHHVEALRERLELLWLGAQVNVKRWGRE